VFNLTAVQYKDVQLNIGMLWNTFLFLLTIFAIKAVDRRNLRTISDYNHILTKKLHSAPFLNK